jgi:hypothetical protein
LYLPHPVLSLSLSLSLSLLIDLPPSPLPPVSTVSLAFPAFLAYSAAFSASNPHYHTL